MQISNMGGRDTSTWPPAASYDMYQQETILTAEKLRLEPGIPIWDMVVQSYVLPAAPNTHPDYY